LGDGVLQLEEINPNNKNNKANIQEFFFKKEIIA